MLFSKEITAPCQRCGANIYNTPNVKLVIDHKIPVELGGDTTIDNLWTLCSDCNGGKQAFFSDPKAEEVKEIMKMSSAGKRLPPILNSTLS